ncbi:MAG: MoaD/ThiS family protein [Candidatus Methanofastidiosum sp.]|nr:MoaD/ThiS family protein [Methanofastidiosum sp.]
MKVTVKYFALFKDLTGKIQESMEIKKGKTTNDLLGIIMKKYKLKDNVNIVMALNQEYIKTDALLNDGDEVAIMMPSSGG